MGTKATSHLEEVRGREVLAWRGLESVPRFRPPFTLARVSYDFDLAIRPIER
ncbi:UNVERIFIED_ORG: hypothetical protein GGE44_000918 [Rhizobium esperanzae]